MRKLRNIILIFILCSITGCMIESCCDDCTYIEEKISAYANESGVTVRIVAIIYNNTYEKLIADGDTLHSSFYYREKPEEWDSYVQINCDSITNNCSNQYRIELHFLGDSEKCLFFDGPVEHNGIDIRSWDSYKRGKEIEDWADFWAGIEYVYAITQEHKELAKEEYCNK
ncbi:MAG: hypothetical protein LBC85_03385 [Fibromonadaceae bacterium]|jgi:hypothetical protein|nr:hypothetical protein [Fibromonadaceae bacterium]